MLEDHARPVQPVTKGEQEQMITFGYGLNWACMIVEH